MSKLKPVAKVIIYKKLYEQAKPCVNSIVKWLRKTATEIERKHKTYTNATFTKWE